MSKPSVLFFITPSIVLAGKTRVPIRHLEFGGSGNRVFKLLRQLARLLRS